MLEFPSLLQIRWNFEENMFLKTPCFRNFTILVDGDVFFILRRVEEGEGEDGDSCCAPDVHVFISFRDGLIKEGQ